MTNATHLSVSEIVELYTLRWQIELFFKELKSTLGFHQNKFKTFEAVEGWGELTVTTVLYLKWYGGEQEYRSARRRKPRKAGGNTNAFTASAKPFVPAHRKLIFSTSQSGLKPMEAFVN